MHVRTRSILLLLFGAQIYGTVAKLASAKKRISTWLCWCGNCRSFGVQIRNIKPWLDKNFDENL